MKRPWLEIKSLSLSVIPSTKEQHLMVTPFLLQLHPISLKLSAIATCNIIMLEIFLHFNFEHNSK